MGHAYSSILADVFARFKRIDNHKVHFLTGTDEHGLKIQKAAEKNNLDPLDYCNKISKIFEDLAKKLNLSNNDFIRTTEKRHYKSVNDIWNRLIKSGDIYLSKYKAWYSVSDQAYYNSEEIRLNNINLMGSLSTNNNIFKMMYWNDEQIIINAGLTNEQSIMNISSTNKTIPLRIDLNLF